MQPEVGNKHAADDSDQVRHERQRKKHDQRGDKARNREFFDRVGAEGAQRIDLLAHLHRPELRCVFCAGPGGEHQSRDDRPQLPNQGQRGRAAYKELGAECFKAVSAFDRHDDSHEQAGEEDDQERLRPYQIHLFHRVPPVPPHRRERPDVLERENRILLEPLNRPLEGANGRYLFRQLSHAHRARRRSSAVRTSTAWSTSTILEKG